MSALLPLPVALPLAVGAILLLVERYPLAQRIASALALATVLGAGLAILFHVEEHGILVMHLGGWPAPFGIPLVADLFSALMVSVAALIGLASLGLTAVTASSWRQSYIHPLFLAMVAGINGVFLTGDLFNLYVFFEVTLMTSFALMAIGGRALQTEGAFKYVVINLLASTLFLVSIGLLYGLLGTLNLADLSQRISRVEDGRLVTVAAVLLLSAFSIKAALVPFHFWLPWAYTYIPPGIAVFFGGVLTKVGVYAILRLFTLVFDHDPGFLQPVLLALAGLSMAVGVLGAAAQHDMRTILSYHITSQIGYMVMGVGLFTVPSVAAGIFFLLHNMPVKSALFAVAGSVESLSGSGKLEQVAGVARLYPLLGVFFLIPALSLAGIPPFSGFWGKLALLQAGLEVRQFAIVGVAVLVSFLTLFSMAKIWHSSFWGDSPEGQGRRPYLGFLPPAVLLSVVTIVMGLGAQRMLEIATEAARSLMNPAEYIDAVMMGG